MRMFVIASIHINGGIECHYVSKDMSVNELLTCLKLNALTTVDKLCSSHACDVSSATSSHYILSFKFNRRIFIMKLPGLSVLYFTSLKFYKKDDNCLEVKPSGGNESANGRSSICALQQNMRLL
jgi:hypothetical protein